jgi:hypothetical protein
MVNTAIERNRETRELEAAGYRVCDRCLTRRRLWLFEYDPIGRRYARTCSICTEEVPEPKKNGHRLTLEERVEALEAYCESSERYRATLHAAKIADAIDRPFINLLADAAQACSKMFSRIRK